MKLFELVDQFKALEALEDSDDLPPEVIADTLEGLEGDFEQKAIAVAQFILSLEAQAEARMVAAHKMAERARRVVKRAESIKHYLLFNMQAVNMKKIDTEEISIRRQNNPPAVQITDMNLIPESFMREPPPPLKVPDKALIKEALQAGSEVPGCYIESGEHLRIVI